MFFGGITQNKGVQVFKDVTAANPTMKLFGPDGVAESAFATSLARRSRSRHYITNPTLDPKLYPPAAQDFFASSRRSSATTPDPYAIYGYEAMKVALLAIQNAGDKGNDRQAVIDAFFKIKDRDSVARQVLDRRERRHDALRLRRGSRRGRQARVRQGDQGPDAGLKP